MNYPQNYGYGGKPMSMQHQQMMQQQMQRQMMMQGGIPPQIQMHQNMVVMPNQQVPMMARQGQTPPPNFNFGQQNNQMQHGLANNSNDQKSITIKKEVTGLKQRDNMLHKSYYDPAWTDQINEYNVLDYFCQATNPFYTTNCNNEIIKTQRGSLEQLRSMTGIEYFVVHQQSPILFIIRKVERLSPDEVKPLANYYVIAGKVYQAPDISSIITSRLSSTIQHLRNAYDKVSEKANYHPGVGYWWDHDEVASKSDDFDSLATPFQVRSTGKLINDLQISLHRQKMSKINSAQSEKSRLTSSSQKTQIKKRKII